MIVIFGLKTKMKFLLKGREREMGIGGLMRKQEKT